MMMLTTLSVFDENYNIKPVCVGVRMSAEDDGFQRLSKEGWGDVHA